MHVPSLQARSPSPQCGLSVRSQVKGQNIFNQTNIKKRIITDIITEICVLIMLYHAKLGSVTGEPARVFISMAWVKSHCCHQASRLFSQTTMQPSTILILAGGRIRSEISVERPNLRRYSAALMSGVELVHGVASSFKYPVVSTCVTVSGQSTTLFQTSMQCNGVSPIMKMVLNHLYQ